MVSPQGLVLLSALLTCSSANSFHQIHPRVNLGPSNHVVIEGTSANNTDSFLNIRFGQDTSGANRFAPSKPFNYPPNSVINATTSGAACPQQHYPVPSFPIFDNVTNISEDCLTLRVDRPANTSSAAKLPVMVWIYGGGDTVGQIYDSAYDPRKLVSGAAAHETPIIFVAMNYRLGIFGFASSPALNASDSLNVGLLDQRLALEWVKTHIASFGGDPDNVTVFGESDGATAVGLHITAYGGTRHPLFRRGIIESGSAMTDSGIASGTSAKHTARLTKLLKCTASTSAKELACLRKLPLRTLLAAAVKYEFSINADGGLDVFIPTAPSSFIPDRPAKLLATGKFTRNIDIISGWNENDGSFFVSTDPTTIQTDQQIAQKFASSFPSMSSENIAKALLLYPISEFPSDPSQNISAQWYRASRMIRDSQYTCPNLYTTQMNQKFSDSNTRNYLYAMNQTMFRLYLDAIDMTFYQVCHFSDIPYVFNQAATKYVGYASRSDVLLASKISTGWASFAACGNPGKARGSLSGWKEASDQSSSNGTMNIQILGVSHQGMTTSDAYENLSERCAFWTSEDVLAQMGV